MIYIPIWKGEKVTNERLTDKMGILVTIARHTESKWRLVIAILRDIPVRWERMVTIERHIDRTGD